MFVGDGQYGDHTHQKRGVLPPWPRLKQPAVDGHMRVLYDILRKFRDSHQLHLVGRQAVNALRRSIYIGGLVQGQYRHIVHAIGGRIVSKMNMSDQRIFDRLLEKTRAVAYDTAAQSQIRTHEPSTPNSHSDRSIASSLLPDTGLA